MAFTKTTPVAMPPVSMENRDASGPVIAGVTVTVSSDGITYGASAGTVHNNGDGVWSYTPTAGEMDNDAVYAKFSIAGAPSQVAVLYPDSRIVSQLSGAYAGRIWIDTGAGNTGTVVNVDGTFDNPVSTLAAATILANSLQRVAHVAPKSSLTLLVAHPNWRMDGHDYTVALNGQSVDGTEFVGANVSGNDSGTNPDPTIYNRCNMGAGSLGRHVFLNCFVGGTITLGEGGNFRWDGCSSSQSDITPIIDYVGIAQAKTVSIHKFSGDLEIQNHRVDHTTEIEMDGRLTINANCNGGTIRLSGNCELVDNSGGAVTIEDESRIDQGQVALAMFAFDTGESYSSAVPGSPVKETADNSVTTGLELSATGLDLILIDGIPFPKATELMAASVAGQITTAGQDPEIFVGLDKATTRLTVANDANGNRTAITYNTA